MTNEQESPNIYRQFISEELKRIEVHGKELESLTEFVEDGGFTETEARKIVLDTELESLK